MLDDVFLTKENCLLVERQIDEYCRADKHLEAAEAAKSYIGKVAPLCEFHARGIYLHAFSLYLGGHYNKAWESVEVGLAIASKLPASVLPRLYLLAAEIASACQRNEDANRLLNEYRRLPTRPSDHKVLQVKLLRLELFLTNSSSAANRAERLVRRLIASGDTKEAAFLLCAMGALYLRNGDAEKAESCWQRGLSTSDADSAIRTDILIHLGRSQQLKGNLQASSNLYRQAVLVAPSCAQRCDALLRNALVRFDLNQKTAATEELHLAIESLNRPIPDSLLPLIRFAAKSICGGEGELIDMSDTSTDEFQVLTVDDLIDPDHDASRAAYARGSELWIAGLESDAEFWFRRAWECSQSRSNPEVAWRTAIFLGRIAGRRDLFCSDIAENSSQLESIKWLSRALEILEMQSETIDTPINRAHYRFQLRSVAMELFERAARCGDVGTAFKYSELLRGKLLADFMSDNSVVNRGIGFIWNNLKSKFLFRKMDDGMDRIRMRLKHDEVFIMLSELDSCIAAIVITNNQLPSIKIREIDTTRYRSAMVDFSAGLESQLAAYRAGDDLDILKTSFHKLLAEIASSELGELFRDILSEYNRRVVLLSLDGRLGIVPFHALPIDGRYLVETKIVAYVPFCDVLRRAPVLRTPTTRTRGLLVSENEQSLPNAKDEAIRIRSRYSRCIHLHGDNADAKNILSAVDKCEFLHFACHGDTNADSPLNASLQLPSGELWSAGFVANTLRLSGKLCVLNCCKTGEQSKQIAGESFSIASSFLAAGASGVIAALWSLPDEESAFLIGRFYDYLESQSCMQAIAHVQREAILSGMSPLFWAPFVFVGAGRERRF
ncbi:MAG: CHAT domain-containing protein [Pirellula sp.]